MAIKVKGHERGTPSGWDKVGVNRWRNKGMIVDVSMSSQDFHYLTHPAWVMTAKHERSNIYFEDMVFPTRAKALTYAKEYMKSH